MKQQLLFYILFFVVGIRGIAQTDHNNFETKLLVFTKVNSSVHESREAGIFMLKQIADKNHLNIQFTEDSLDFYAEYLNQFDVVMWLSTSGDVLGEKEEVAFENYISNGGNYVGIHAASATEYDWKWYGHLVGTFFDDHPVKQTATVRIEEFDHPSTHDLPSEWVRYDEWYNWQGDLHENIRVLLTVDESTYEGGKHGKFHPISWCQELQNGSRSWYTAMGHLSEHYEDENFEKHILGGILWAAGKTKDNSKENEK